MSATQQILLSHSNIENDSEEEFVGPFSSWTNIKTVYGAIGDGITDDTLAIQNALDDLGVNISTIWLPSGNYKITNTLFVEGREYVNIIGEHPLTTKISWHGSDNGVMFHVNGLVYYRTNRLTFDGRNIASVAINNSWDGVGLYFDTANEYKDIIFKDLQIGIQGGALGHGFAETAIIRCKFLRCQQAGISLRCFNSLDIWVWYCLFEDCGYGITNLLNAGAGDFKVYDCVFKRSRLQDMSIGHVGGTFGIRNNYSIDSGSFFYGDGTANPGVITFQNNTVLDSKYGFIYIINLGPVFVVDNVVRNKVLGPSVPAIATIANWEFSEVFSIGNLFEATGVYNVRGRIHSIDDQIVSSGVTGLEPVLPETPLNYNRKIFEVPIGSTSSQIQTIINTAALENGKKPVVHFPNTVINLDSTLYIPANNDLQIIGDGGRSRISWTGVDNGPMFLLRGPSKVTFKDFNLNGNSIANGILIENCDQEDSRIFMDQVNLSNYFINILVNQLDYTNVQLHNFSHAGVSSDSGASVKVIGGLSASSDVWLGGKTNIFTGASSNSALSYEFINGAHVNVCDIWYESGFNYYKFLKLTGKSDVTFSSSYVTTAGNSIIPAFDIKDFHGNATFLNVFTYNNIGISGDCSDANILCIGMVGPSDNFINNTSNANVLILNTTTMETDRNISFTHQISEVGIYDEQFIRDRLSQIRAEKPAKLSKKPYGVTDVRMYRVYVWQSLIGIQLDV